MKSAYKYISKSWLTSNKKSRLIEWRAKGSIYRIAKPTRPERAHALGWKAKQGFIAVRVAIRKGLRKRPKPAKGRKIGKYGRFFTPGISMQRMAEQRAGRKFMNMEVLNSYFAGEDGVSKFYEVLLLDRNHPSVLANRNAAGIARQRGRAFRGLTSAGRKGRSERRKRKY